MVPLVAKFGCMEKLVVWISAFATPASWSVFDSAVALSLASVRAAEAVGSETSTPILRVSRFGVAVACPEACTVSLGAVLPHAGVGVAALVPELVQADSTMPAMPARARGPMVVNNGRRFGMMCLMEFSLGSAWTSVGMPGGLLNRSRMGWTSGCRCNSVGAARCQG